jgi:hypothetical protein
MSIQAEIDAVVGAFVEDLAELVRRAALEEIRRALGATAAESWSAAHEPRRAPAAAESRRARQPAAAEPTPRVVPPSTPEPTPPVRKLLSPNRRGRLIVVPSTSSQPPSQPRPEAPPPSAPPVEAAAPQPPKAPSTPPPESESTPARKWVVVRRPARDRVATAANGGAPDSTDAPPASVEPPTQPVPQPAANGESV